MSISKLYKTQKDYPIYFSCQNEIYDTSTIKSNPKKICIIKQKDNTNRTCTIKNIISDFVDDIIISHFEEKNKSWNSADYYYNLSYKNAISKQTDIKQKDNKLLSYQNTLSNSKKYLGLSVVALSTLLNVTRPTIYSYLNGNEPKDTSADTIIKKLNKIINLVSIDYSLNSFSTIFKRRDDKGKTLVDYLKEENENYLKFATFLCEEEVKRQSKIIRITSKNKSNPEEFSIPISYED